MENELLTVASKCVKTRNKNNEQGGSKRVTREARETIVRNLVRREVTVVATFSSFPVACFMKCKQGMAIIPRIEISVARWALIFRMTYLCKTEWKESTNE